MHKNPVRISHILTRPLYSANHELSHVVKILVFYHGFSQAQSLKHITGPRAEKPSFKIILLKKFKGRPYIERFLSDKTK
jgi:hypothetical protein